MPAALFGTVARTVGMTVSVCGFPAPVGAVAEIERQTGPPLLAEVIGFRPGELLTEPHDFLMVELAFSTCPLVVPLGLIKWHANGTMMTILPKVVAPQHVFRLERTHNPV